MNSASSDARQRLAAAQVALAHDDTDALRSEAANAAVHLGDWRTAIEHLHALVRRHPNNATLRRHLGSAISNLARSALERGDAVAARAGFEQALAIWPDNVPALFNAATAALVAGDATVAVTRLERLVALAPHDTEARLLLGEAQLDAGHSDVAADTLRGINVPPALGTRATAAFARVGEAAATLASNAAGEREARALLINGETDAARTLWRRIATRSALPDAEHLRSRLAEQLALSPVPKNTAAIDAERERFRAVIDQLFPDLSPAKLGAGHVPLDALEWTNFYLAYHGRDDHALQARYGDWLTTAAAAITPEFAAPPPRSVRRRPRVGIISAFLHYCTIGSYFGAWIGALREAGFEVIMIALGPHHDEFTARLEATANRALRPNGDLRAIATSVRGTKCDLLIYPEIGMDPRVQVLAALRLAPMQAMAWGHPVTSGLPTIDAYFSCAAMEPIDAMGHYRERLLPLPSIGTRYLHPGAPPPQPRSELGLPNDRKLVLVPQSAFKLHPDNDTVLATLLDAAPDADLVLFAGDAPGATQRLRARFTVAGIDAKRLHWLPLAGRKRYLEINHACDIMLDTLHWSGGNTSIDALAVGLPVVTAAGRFMRGRQTTAMLTLIGLEELCGDPTTLATRAASLLCDEARRAALSENLRADMPALLGDATPLASLGEAVHALLN